jgi:CheY-like chemotaxis protein
LCDAAVLDGWKMKRTEIGKRRILVVDDQPAVRAAIKMLLEFDGHEIETAGSGPEALAMIQEEKFDLILTDYSMPVMTGRELAVEIKARLPSQPVGMITAYASMFRAFSEPDTGTDFLLNKPFGLEELRAAIASALSEENT